jgi:phenylalanyl-tRNA synthetase alpha chain
MDYTQQKVIETRKLLLSSERLKTLADKSDVSKAKELRELYQYIGTLPTEQRAAFGKEVNQLRDEIVEKLDSIRELDQSLTPIDLSAPFDINLPIEQQPKLLTADHGSIHPLMRELATILDIFYRMGFTAIESRQIDDDFHMFGSLNFPVGHPARDDYDTFITKEGLIAPAHTSTMQNRVLKQYKTDLEADLPIAVVIPGRVFRNEDMDARHEHTFYQLEGIYVDKTIHAGNLIATLKTFFQAYYTKDLDIKIQPFYFPFTEPSFELVMSCPFCSKKGCSVCSQVGWIEMVGCGMIHPNVLSAANIDPTKYSGFAWGGGIDRLVMMKYNIEDIRYFEAGKLDFLRQFL